MKPATHNNNNSNSNNNEGDDVRLGTEDPFRSPR